jgi:Holliday junction resolvase
MTPEEISQLAFLLYPHIVKTKPDATSVDSLAARLKGLQAGLLPEDEFKATVCWLGNCAGVHRIDQTPMPIPELTDEMQAPDLLAFPMVEDKPFPVLIEVKARQDQRLKWSERYLSSLRRFAECVRLPLLIAWKCGALWFLVDHRHFEKNVTAYQLTWRKAMMEDLYCVLFRNLRIQMNPNVELVLDSEILNEVPGNPDGLLPEGPYHMKILRAGFFTGSGEAKTVQPEHMALFISCPDETEVRRTGKQTCQQVFRPQPDTSFTLSNVLLTELSMLSKADEVDWHSVLTGETFKSSGQQYAASLNAGIDNEVIRYVLDVIPSTWPDFLPRKS